uniref:Uncharacterized protein n=1 Tax=Cannabis sativa TaxID=3483 RepID=A0A803PJL0_CANSA
MATDQTYMNNNNETINLGIINVPITNSKAPPVDTTVGGRGHTTTTPLNIFPQFLGLVGETSTLVTTLGYFPPITPIPATEGIVLLISTQYTTVQEQMQALEAEITGRNQTHTRCPQRIPNQCRMDNNQVTNSTRRHNEHANLVNNRNPYGLDLKLPICDLACGKGRSS